VLLTAGSATVADFGIAKAISASRTMERQATLTEVGAAIGTPAYMAPEQAAGDPRTDHRADFYAFGCMAYELLAGRPPFAGRAPQQMLAAQMTEIPPSIASIRPETPAELEALVSRCLEKDAGRRPQHAAELVRALESAPTPGAVPSGLLLERRILGKALASYAAGVIVITLLAKLAIAELGLPDWVLTAVLIVMALGLPAVIVTWYVQRVTRLASTVAPTVTPGGSMSVQQGPMATLALKAGPHISWRRTLLGGATSLAVLVVIVAAFMAMRAFGIGPAGSLFAKGSLSAKDRILVADFHSPAADSGLGNVISEALRTNLGQSRAINVVSSAGIADALRRMQRSTDARLDLSLARELAEREGVKAVVAGDVVSAGAGFVITARLIDAAGGAELASFRSAAVDAGDIIPAIDRLTRDVREKIGESLKSVRGSAPLSAVTTWSLPALRKYTEGMRLHYRQADYARAAAAFEEATTLDSTFAMAYLREGTSYQNAAMHAAKRDSARARAFALRDHLPPIERLLVEALHYEINGWRDSAINAYEQSLAIDSNQAYVLNILGNLYRGRREPARAESIYRKAMTLKDGAAQPSGNLIRALLEEGKVAEAKSQIDASFKEFPTYRSTPLTMSAVIAFATGRYDSAEVFLEQASRAERSTIARSAITFRADVETARGQLGVALRLRDSLLARDRGVENISNMRGRLIDRAIDSIHQDNWIRERHELAVPRLDALVRDGGDTIPWPQLLGIAREYAYAGRPDKARAALDRFERTAHDSLVNRQSGFFRAWSEGEIALAERQYREAIAKFRASDNLYDGRQHGCALCTPILMARAYDLANMPDSAIAAFERYLATPASTFRFVMDADFLAGTFKRLGELYDAKGDHQKAAMYYAKFVELWKDADLDLQPRVTEVRKRLARLSESETKR